MKGLGVMNDITNEKLLISPVEAAKLLGVGRTTIYAWIKEGIVPVVRFPKCRNIYISVTALHNMIAEYTVTSTNGGGNDE